jgi:uncharacterized protein (DUF433 family)
VSQNSSLEAAKIRKMTATETKTRWQYLEQRPHPWRQQLSFKGKRLRPFTVWITMQVELMTPEEAALDWDLPLAAVQEAIAYCEANRELLEREIVQYCFTQ